MTSELANLARIGTLKVEPPAAGEVAGLVSSGEARLQDAGNADLAVDSRFDLAYNAAHSLALAVATFFWLLFHSQAARSYQRHPEH